jgi:hypothetical protein
MMAIAEMLAMLGRVPNVARVVDVTYKENENGE